MAQNAIVRRNRQNSLKSTGPKTAAGKAVAARNRMRHGLRANPASRDGEDGRQFRDLHKRLVQQIRPRDELEYGLVHRIAVALWRLQRSARIDAALSSLSVRQVAPLREEAQAWIERVNAAWNVEFVQETDPKLLRQRRAEGRLGPDQMWFRPIRYGIAGLDRLRKEMMARGAGITAMLNMIEDLIDRMIRWPTLFHQDHAEKLAWLLGAPACSFWTVEPGHELPGEEASGSPILSLIDTARRREPGTDLPRRLRNLIDARLDTLRQQRLLCAQKYTRQEETLRETAGLPAGPGHAGPADPIRDARGAELAAVYRATGEAAWRCARIAPLPAIRTDAGRNGSGSGTGADAADRSDAEEEETAERSQMRRRG